MGMSALYSAAYGYASSGLSYLNEKTGAVEKATSGLNYVCGIMNGGMKTVNVGVAGYNTYKVYELNNRNYYNITSGLANGTFVLTQLGEAYAVVADDPEMRKNLNAASGIAQVAVQILNPLSRTGTIDKKAIWQIVKVTALRTADFLDLVAKREGVSYTSIYFVVTSAIELPTFLKAL